MIKYLIGALIGAILGYLVLYRLIGCSSGSCPITANPYLSTVYGLVLGVLVAGLITVPSKTAGMSEIAQTSTAQYIKITPEDAKAKIDSGDEIIIVDVRTEEEYNAGHIPNAILVPNETITDTRPELLPELETEVLVYCRSGSRSAQAARKLLAIGYTRVYDFGGIIDWPYDTSLEPWQH